MIYQNVIYSSRPLDAFWLNLIINAIAKNSSRIKFGNNIGFTPDLIFLTIVLPCSLKHTTERTSLEHVRICSYVSKIV